MTRLLLVAACLLLTACAPVVYVTPPAAVPGGGAALYEQARIVAAQETEAAGLQATAHAVATANRQMTQEAIADTMALATLAAAQTQDAVSATRAVATQRADATRVAWSESAAATGTAEVAHAIATEMISRERQHTQIQTASDVLTALLKILLILAGLVGLWWLAGALAADVTRRQNAAAVRDTPIGPVLIVTTPQGLAAQLLTQPAQLAAPVTELEPADTIRYTVAGEQAAPLVADWRLARDAAEREEVAALLRAAIDVEGEGGRKIPRYAKLAGWQTNPDGWKRLTDKLLLAGHVTKAAGRAGGTFLTRGRTLYALLAAVTDGALSLSPVDVVSANEAP